MLWVTELHSGADCLRKLSETSGADKPETLRSTRLRKHIATVSQILHLDENELEVLAKFMGHDIRTHRAYYRLPDETMQLAKMTKFLLNLEKPGSLTEMKGKSWKDMQVSANEEVVEDPGDADSNDECSDADVEDNAAAQELQEPEAMLEETDDNASKVRSTTSSSNVPQKTTKRKAWSTDERDAIMKHFSGLILRNKLPGKTEIERVMVKEKSLHSRSWRNIKDFCRNCIVSKSRKLH
ncbi:hypothetical protein BSL78_05725 [Apostichopus japonicus]|uniref:Uncharacterized protein n=1 Tax=Stichopus japonicus TaxID=307972 RepID=A0A2G8LAP8_STIJA|nr:hypothetical protein BSL78_05725 [Apostichopus japonicus]